MPRPKVDGGAGTWSIRQASATIGISQRAIREIAARGFINADAIGEPEILLLRTVHAVDRAATIGSPDPVLGRMRDETVARFARYAFDNPSPASVLAVTDTDARLAATPAELASVLGLHADRPVLLLPIGVWATQQREMKAAS